MNYKDKDGKRKQKWVSTKLKVRGNKKQALAKAEEIRLEFENSLNFNEISNNKSHKKENNILFFDFLSNWLETIERPTIEISTYTAYHQMLDSRIKNYFSENPVKLVDMQPVDIQNFYNNLLADGLSGNTVRHYHALIRKCLDYAFKMDIIDNNIADKVQKPKKEQFIGSFYNENELNELFEVSKSDPMELMILITAFYGLRRSEVLGLRWDAFDFENKTITIKHTVVVAKVDGERQLFMKDRTKK